MKGLFGKVTAIALVVILSIICTVQAGAVMALPLKVGDVDRDNNVTVIDATLIARFLAKLQKPTELQEALSDADGDKEMTILDSTVIQRELAGLPGLFTGALITDYVVGFTSFHADCEISIADHYFTADVCYIGVPVTFYPKAYGGPRRYSLSVNGETVYEVGAKDYDINKGIPLTFLEEGEHVITCDAECNYGQHTTSTRRVKVEKLPEDGSPAVMGAVFYDEDYRSSGDSVMTVHAAGGTAPYQYQYTLYYDDLSPLCISSDGEITPEPAPSRYTTGFIGENEINLIGMFSKYVPKPSAGEKSDVMCAEITVRDAEGRISQPVIASYIGYEICY